MAADAALNETVDGGLAACDAGGEKKWTFDCPPVSREIVESGVMYAVMVVKPGLLEVSAFAGAPAENPRRSCPTRNDQVAGAARG